METELENIIRENTRTTLRILLQMNNEYQLSEDDVFLLSVALNMTSIPQKYINKEKIIISDQTGGWGNGTYFSYALTIGSDEISIFSTEWVVDFEGRYYTSEYKYSVPYDEKVTELNIFDRDKKDIKTAFEEINRFIKQSTSSDYFNIFSELNNLKKTKLSTLDFEIQLTKLKLSTGEARNSSSNKLARFNRKINALIAKRATII
jgi:hypothetical protein